MNCKAITAAGTQCKNSAKFGHELCGIHIKLKVVDEQSCSAILGNGEKCSRHAIPGNPHVECKLHQTIRQKRVQKAEDIRSALEIRRLILPHVGFRIGLDEHLLIIEGVRLRRTTGWTYEQVVEHLLARIPPRAEPELVDIYHDKQNVHTRAVSTQTNKGIDILFKIPVPETQDTLAEIQRMWTSMFTYRPVDPRVYTDMEYWYKQITCRDAGDFLYKRVLDHAWASIKLRTNKDEVITLNRRLQQECTEAYGMCCDGHINRIINAFVGFIDDIAPPIPIGEILQEKMAQIAGIEDLEERIIRATSVFDELHITPEAAGPWLEALA